MRIWLHNLLTAILLVALDAIGGAERIELTSGGAIVWLSLLAVGIAFAGTRSTFRRRAIARRRRSKRFMGERIERIDTWAYQEQWPAAAPTAAGTHNVQSALL